MNKSTGTIIPKSLLLGTPSNLAQKSEVVVLASELLSVPQSSHEHLLLMNRSASGNEGVNTIIFAVCSLCIAMEFM